MNKRIYHKSLFPDYNTPETNVITTTDIEPAISIDHINRLVTDFTYLREVLGVASLRPMADGAIIKRYKASVKNIAAQVPEGQVIDLSKVDRKKLDDVEITLKKYRKSTTAETITRSGYQRAVNDTDTALLDEIRFGVLGEFVRGITTDAVDAGTTQTTLQMALANLWGKTRTYFSGKAARMVYFVNPLDVAAYLGSAQINSQDEFGLVYLENFLGLGTTILDGGITAGTVYATARENLNGAYVSAASGVGQAFGMTSDETGLVAMKHYTGDDRATVDTLIFSGVTFYAEDPAGVFKAPFTTP